MASIRSLTRWEEKAACRSSVHLDWSEPDPEDIPLMVTVCNSCPVKEPCTQLLIKLLHEGLLTPTGVWAGMYLPDHWK